MEKENNIPTAENLENTIPVENNVVSPEQEKTVHTERRCMNCQALLEDGQMFCPECGASQKKVCMQCGAEVQDDQAFCPSCGQKVTGNTGQNSQNAISQFNANLEQKNSKKKLIPIILCVVLIIAGIIGCISYSSMQKKAVENYISNAETFYTDVLASGIKMENIGNEIQTAWKAYVNSSYYNGKRYYSVDSAVAAGQASQSTNISAVKSSDSQIQSLYKKLLSPPKSDDPILQEIKDAVKETYDAYEDMYDCIISPTGNYTSWRNSFSSVDSELSDAINDLNSLLN